MRGGCGSFVVINAASHAAEVGLAAKIPDIVALCDFEGQGIAEAQYLHVARPEARFIRAVALLRDQAAQIPVVPVLSAQPVTFPAAFD